MSKSRPAAKSCRELQNENVHPAARIFKMMPRAELLELADDIKVNGLRHRPIYFVTRAGRQLLLDGRNRLAAMELAGLPTDSEGIMVEEGKVDPFDYVLSVNLHRRHLSAEDKRNVVIELVKAQPGKSDRIIAQTAKVSPTTVGTIRHELENVGAVSKLDTRTDATGRSQPATKPARVTSPDAKAQSEPEVAVTPGVNDAVEVDPQPEEVDPQPDEDHDTPAASVEVDLNSIFRRHLDELKRHKRAIAHSDERGLIVHCRKYLKLNGLSHSDLAPTRQLSRPQRWQDAVSALQAIQSEYQDWLDNLPENLASGSKAEQLARGDHRHRFVRIGGNRLPIGERMTGTTMNAAQVAVYIGRRFAGNVVEQASGEWLALSDDDAALGLFPTRKAATAAIVASAERVR